MPRNRLQCTARYVCEVNYKISK